MLDHYTYSFEPALPMIARLQQLDIPLILVSSKTQAEIVELRRALANNHPFIVENGAAVFIPKGYFQQQPADTRDFGEYWIHEMSSPREHWLALLASLEQEFSGAFDSFHSAGVPGIMAMTGLTEEQAVAANNRSYSEPVRWLGQPADESKFILRLQEAGATVMKGGRFLSVSDNCDKGQALIWLRSQYQASALNKVTDLAIGDSKNDCAMLEVSQTALLVSSPVHDFPVLARTDNVIHSQQKGPAGWAEGVAQWLNTTNSA